MEAKKAVNLSLPVAVINEVDNLARPLKAKQKWIVNTAAVLVLMDLPEETRRTIMMQVAAADFGLGTFGKLIETAKAGRLRKEAEASAGTPPAAHKKATA